jgi:hypothetical protein
MNLQDIVAGMNSLGPTTAASFAGEKEGLANLMTQAQTQKEQQLAQQYGLQNQLRQATMGSDISLAQSNATKGGLEAQMKGLDYEQAIATHPFKVNNAITAEQLTGLKQMETMAGQIIGVISQSKDPEMAKQQLLASGRIPQDSPMFQLMSKTPAQLLPSVYTNFKNYVATTEGDYLKKIGEIKETGKWHKEVEGMRQAGQDKRVAAGQNASSAFQKFLMLPPDRQKTTLEYAMSSRTNPFTGEPLTEEGLRHFQTMMNSVVQANQAKMDAANRGGIVPSTTPGGGIGFKDRPSTGITQITPSASGEALPQGTEGQTKSGIKYRITQ